MLGQTTTHTTLLTRLCQEKDPSAWREFHDRYGELIRAFARHRGLQPSDCDDIAQDVMLSLAKAMPGFRYDPAKGKFRSYLKTATLRAVFRRNQQKHGTAALGSVEEATRVASEDAGVEEAWELEWRQYHLRLAMRTIQVEFNPTVLEAFQRYAIEGGGARDTAEALNMSVDQVYQAKSHIMKRLAQLIESQVRDEG